MRDSSRLSLPIFLFALVSIFSFPNVCYSSPLDKLSDGLSSLLGIGCDHPSSKLPEPEWVSLGYERDGYYLGVGKVAPGNNSHPLELENKAKDDAITALAKKIKLIVTSEFTHYESAEMVGNNYKIKERIESNDKISTVLEMEGSRIGGLWQNPDTCEMYALATMTRSQVNKIREKAKSKISFNLMEQFLKEALEGKGGNSYVLKNYQYARKYLQKTNFGLLSEVKPKSYYGDKITEGIHTFQQKLNSQQNLILLSVAYVQRGVSPQVVEAILSGLVSRGGVERLFGKCNAGEKLDKCFEIAKHRGNKRIAFLKFRKKVSRHPLFPSVEGTLYVKRTDYDVSTRRSIWSKKVHWEVTERDEKHLPWRVAADGIIRENKLIPKKR